LFLSLVEEANFRGKKQHRDVGMQWYNIDNYSGYGCGYGGMYSRLWLACIGSMSNRSIKAKKFHYRDRIR
jgi:hypothetical protein